MSWRTRVKALFFSMILLSASGCSWITSKRSLFGDEEAISTDSANGNEVVPKAQYDQLASKYNSLLEQTKNLPVNDSASSPNLQSEGQDLVGQLSQVPSTPKNPELAETVDVFAKLGNETQIDTQAAVP